MNEICHYRIIFDIRKGPGYLYNLFDVLPKLTRCEMKVRQV